MSASAFLPSSARLGLAALLLLCVVLAPAPLRAQADSGGGFLSAPEVPSIPGRYAGDSASAPEVTITETEEGTVYEYRVKGQVYMVKIQPTVGPPYFLLDTNGDGVLDVEERQAPDLAVPQWLLFSW
ncbi:DUF2782 domain-containing protein [Lamprobacter modestohalophilus]|uniref:DUF2782 domain-containing protein n=1 Tax=Lamprobacter modestohalophilus TaxID=1064514 RepID=UPI002ADEB0E0|nr:DUF2782 domain-containing protein [Lamprobacter modestohalophilus]MEA1049140.1 DUF2782 domain-containing protein [Lamprobacter modestohalophilus]